MNEPINSGSHNKIKNEKKQKMEGEINNFIFVWATVLSSLYYCRKAGDHFRHGYGRRVAILPVACLFFFLPLNLTTIHLGGTTSFFIAWLSSFKLILFAFNRGPLFPPPSSAARFIAAACLPIKPLENNSKIPTRKPFSGINFAVKAAILVLCIRVYAYKKFIPEKIILFFYCLHIYFMLEIILAAVAAAVRAAARVELEPQFNEPYLATSLQDFWGRRWNLMVSNILRPTVYDPVRRTCTAAVGPEWAQAAAVAVTFLVSGIMHELVFYNFGRKRPDGEVLCFFILHGGALAAEKAAKKAAKGSGIRIPGIVSGPLTIGFVMWTSFWLFFPPFLRAKGDWKGCTESLAFFEFVRYGRLVSPASITCPLLM